MTFFMRTTPLFSSKNIEISTTKTEAVYTIPEEGGKQVLKRGSGPGRAPGIGIPTEKDVGVRTKTVNLWKSRWISRPYLDPPRIFRKSRLLMRKAFLCLLATTAACAILMR
jgi:hypothetical protein